MAGIITKRSTMIHTPMKDRTVFGPSISRTLASKYEEYERVDPFLAISSVGIPKSMETNKNFTYDRRRKVANASIIDALISHF